MSAVQPYKLSVASSFAPARASARTTSRCPLLAGQTSAGISRLDLGLSEMLTTGLTVVAAIGFIALFFKQSSKNTA